MAVCLVGSLDGDAFADPPAVTSTGQPPVALSAGASNAGELSGVAWIAGDEYLAIGDNGASMLWRLTVTVDPATGRIESASVAGALAAPGLAIDGEGVAFVPSRGSVLAVDEAVSAIREFRLDDGAPVGTLPVPAIFGASNLRANLGLESLGAAGGEIWTANEEALASDGPVSTETLGTLVRIQRFSAALLPVGQWAYRTDPISGLTPLTALERSGVVEVLPLGGTRALVLEREFGGTFVPDFRSRIYFIDVAGADDISARASLAKGGFEPVGKLLLWEGDFALANFEGMTLGPMLDDGCRALLLVSDNGGGLQQVLLALRICESDACPADLDGNGMIDGGDLASVLGSWGDSGSSADLDGDGVVGGGDLAILLGGWGACGG